MNDLRTDMRVRVLVDVPEYEVFRGEIGVVCSKWNLPWEMFEVEFYSEAFGEYRRALLSAEQLEPDAVNTVAPDDNELQPA